MPLCKCGKSFKSPSELVQHIYLGRPNRLSVSRLTPSLTQEMVDKRNAEVDQYDKEHGKV